MFYMCSVVCGMLNMLVMLLVIVCGSVYGLCFVIMCVV